MMTASAAPSPTPPVLAAGRDIDTALGRLGTVLDALEARLAPILTPVPVQGPVPPSTSPTIDLGEAGPPRSLLAADMAASAGRAHDLAERVTRLTGRLEV